MARVRSQLSVSNIILLLSLISLSNTRHRPKNRNIDDPTLTFHLLYEELVEPKP